MNRTKAPDLKLITHLAFNVPEKQLLSNGVPVYLLEGGTDGIVKIELLFLAGSFHQQKPLVAYLAANLLKAGTRGRTSAEISEIFDFYGTYLQVDAQKDIISVSLLVLNKNLEQVLALLQEMVQQPSFPGEELDILLKNKKHQHIVSSGKVAYLARLHFAEQLFGPKHPYGHRLRRRDFDQVKRGDLIDFQGQYFQPGNLVILVSGQVPRDIVERMESHFGGKAWPLIEDPWGEPVHCIPERAEKQLFIEKKDSIQSAIRVGKRIISRGHPDYDRLMITNALLGGFFGSRLMKNIRQEKGFTYGIQSALVSLLRDGYFFVSTQVGKDVCQGAVEQIFHEIRRLRLEPATAAELQTLKNYLSGNFLRSFDGPFARAERFREMLVFGLTPDQFDRFLVELKEISAETIMETSGRYLHEDTMIEVVAGNR